MASGKSFWLFNIKIYHGEQTEDDEISKECRKQRSDDKYVHNFSLKPE
jgi:hypothetical protein